MSQPEPSEAQLPQHAESLEILTRDCEQCSKPMTYLGNAPRHLTHSAIRIYRCYHCNNVVSEEW
jgi:hypothetical protein